MKNIYSLPNILIMMKTLLSPKFKTSNIGNQMRVVSREVNLQSAICNSQFAPPKAAAKLILSSKSLRALALSLIAMLTLVGGAWAGGTYNISSSRTSDAVTANITQCINTNMPTIQATFTNCNSGGGGAN